MTVNLGDDAPDFELPDTQGNLIRLSQLRGQFVVLYFYPRDNTPGCTKEACAFRDLFDRFQAENTLIFGISADDAKSHSKFVSQYQLPFPLLCDVGGKVASLYGSYGLKKFMGREFEGIYRHTLIINPEGKIAKIYRKVKPETHAAEVLQDLESLKS